MSRFKYDPGFEKPAGTLKRGKEVYRIYKGSMEIKNGQPYRYYSTFVITDEGFVYARARVKNTPTTAEFDWSRRWQLVEPVGPAGIKSYLMNKLDQGWKLFDPGIVGSNSRHSKDYKPEFIDVSKEKQGTGPLAEIIKRRKKYDRKKFD